ncbi:hypothetical protein C1H46_017520 [Malus baccata]|uniref:Ribosome assembly factor mrt4 n=1 Tax=Malus baccata TaxID=106549 RepID=A0A540MDG9_MALBA|nr:hypothetical protein C1H46_017520 [Malus baccata]
MPKSKRDRQVTLSKTKKKGREHKETIVNTIRQAAEDYNSAYVFSFENMRNHKFKEFRDQLKSNSRQVHFQDAPLVLVVTGNSLYKFLSHGFHNLGKCIMRDFIVVLRFFLGSNKVMQIALGRSESDEIRPGLHKVSKVLHGDAGLCFTNLPKEEVERLFNEYEEHDFARTGSVSTEKVELMEGPLEQFSHEMEPFLRKQGMPVRLNKGVIELVSDFLVCDEGKPLSPESARILRLLGTKMASFRLHLICRWSPGDFEQYAPGPDDSGIESS